MNYKSRIYHLASNTRHKRRQVFVVLLLAILAISSYQIWGYINPSETEAAWYSTGGTWKFRRKLVIDESKVSGSSNFTDFHVVIDTRIPELKDQAQSDGDDILFTTSDGTTKISHEIEKLDTSTGQLTAWIEIPTLSYNTDTTIYIYYGNPTVSSQQDVGNMWGGSFKAVWHMNDSPSGSVSDSAGTDNALTGTNMDSTNLLGSRIGPYIELLATDEVLSASDSDDLDFIDGDYSILMWQKFPTAINSNQTILGKSDGGYESANDGWGVFYRGSGSPAERSEIRFSDGENSSWNNSNNETTHDDLAWHHLAIVVDRDTERRIYLDNNESTTANTGETGTVNSAASLFLGKLTSGSATDLMAYDEIWLIADSSSITDDFVSTVYANQSNPSTFFRTIGEQEYKYEPSSYWKFDEAVDDTCTGGSNDVCDSMPEKSDGTRSGALWQTPDMCVQGNCLFFDGVDDVVTITNNDTIDFDTSLNDGISVSFWVRPNSDGEGSSGGEIIDKGSHFYCRTDSEDSVYVDLECSIDLNPTDATVNISDGLTRGRWHHVEATYADDSDDDLLVYIDGQLRGTGAGDGAPVGTDSSNLLIGGDTSNNYHGFIDDFKIYPFERTAAEVKTDYIVGAGEAGSGATFGTDRYKFLSDGLNGYWKMDEAADATRLDSSGNSNTLTESASDTIAQVGDKFGNAGDFELGDTEYISAPDSQSLSITGSLTLAAWIKPETVSAGTYNILAKWDGSNESYRLMQNADEIRIELDSSGNYAETTASNLAAGTWYHVVGVYNSATSSASIYINGILATSTTTGTIPSSIGDDVGVFHIGAEDSGTAAEGYYDGAVDEARLYSRALSPSEVQNLYNWAPSPTGYWNFDENTGTGTFTTYDRSTNGNNGTAAGSMTVDDWVSGKFGSAIDFDDSNDLIGIGDPASGILDTDDGEDFSVSGWFKWNSGGTAHDTIVSKYNNVGWRVYINTSTTKLVFDLDDSPDSVTMVSTSNMTSGAWTHFEAVFDEDSDTNSGIWINGTKEDDGSGVSAINSLDTAALFRIGSLNVGAGDIFNGVIDDIRFYNYARNERQIIEDMNGSHPVGGSPIGSPVAHWKFDEGNGTTANDSISQNGSENLTTATTNWTTSGKYNTAYNGADNRRASLADDNDLDFTAAEDMTVSLWFKSDSATNPTANEYLLNKGPTIATDAVGYAIYTADTGGTICFGIDDDSTTFPEDSVCSASDIYDNTWHQIIAIKTANSRLDLFVDGIASGTPDTAISSTGTLANAATFYLGDGNATDGTDEFLGDIDDVKIYRAALTTDQVRVDYNAGSAINFGTGTNERLLVEPSPTPVDFANNLVVHWPFDENTVTPAPVDKSTNNNTGTNVGSMDSTDWTNGKYGSALDFDGSNDAIAILDASDGSVDFNGSDNFSLSAWVYITTMPSTGNQDAIITKWDSKAAEKRGYRLFVENDDADATGNFQVDIYDESANQTITATGANDTVSQNTWYHVTATFNGGTSGTAEDLKLYINGIYVDGNDVNGSFLGLEDVAADFSVGDYDPTNDTTNDTAFTGYIDEVKVFSSRLSQGQVMYEYNRGRPIGWWRFDECSGNTLNNASGNSTYNGTRSGTGATNTSSGTCSSGTSSEAWNNGTTGRFGASLDFDADDDGTGGDDVVTVTNGSVIDFDEGLQNGVTFSAWIYANSDGEANTGNIINKGTNTYCRVDTQSGNNMDLECQLDLGTDRNVNLSGAIPKDTWTHIAMSWSNDSDDDISVWINGVLRGSSTTNTNDTIPADTNGFYIGNNSAGSTTFDGKIDEVQLYNYALSADQIKQVYTGGAVRFE